MPTKPTYTETELEQQYDLCDRTIVRWREAAAQALRRHDWQAFAKAARAVSRWTNLRAQVIERAVSA